MSVIYNSNGALNTREKKYQRKYSPNVELFIKNRIEMTIFSFRYITNSDCSVEHQKK